MRFAQRFQSTTSPLRGWGGAVVNRLSSELTPSRVQPIHDDSVIVNNDKQILERADIGEGVKNLETLQGASGAGAGLDDAK